MPVRYLPQVTLIVSGLAALCGCGSGGGLASVPMPTVVATASVPGFPMAGPAGGATNDGNYCLPSAAYSVQSGNGFVITIAAKGPDDILVQGFDDSGNSTGQAVARIAKGERSARFRLHADPAATVTLVLSISGATSGACNIEPASPSRHISTQTSQTTGAA